MLIIPATPYGTHSDAEKRVYDRLREMTLPGGDIWVAYHSLNLPRHAYKRFGEIDFLVTGPAGLYVLEVKGGGVSCRNGMWIYRDRFGNEFEKPEGPFRQAQSAMLSWIDNMKMKVGDAFPSHATIGYGVIFPDCKWPFPGTEWDRELVADAQDYKDLEGWFRRLIEYWKGKRTNPKQLDGACLKAIRAFIRPEFEAVIPLHIESEKAEERIATLTEEQMNFIDMFESNPRILCSGGAGTGKTFLALELARRWTARGLHVGLVCKSPWLRKYLESKFAVTGLCVACIDSIQSALKRSGRSKFDAIIVDEGQDLFDADSISTLEESLDQSLTNGNWCIFHDINQQSGLIGQHDRDTFEYIRSFKPVELKLNINCRNTNTILETVKQNLGADMGVRGAGAGPKVREHRAESKEEAAMILEREIDEIVECGGVHPGNLTILSLHDFASSSASLLTSETRRKIVVLDEFSFRNFPFSQTSFARIADFKGLENEAVIVIDMKKKPFSAKEIALSYVAMSRARTVLTMIQNN